MRKKLSDQADIFICLVTFVPPFHLVVVLSNTRKNIFTISHAAIIVLAKKKKD